ncbi:ATP-dependent RNA helicase DEAH13 [Trifolium pratense]|nr:ATP-dependent RNA helicase DEAH13 [Trifolium pratense]XP_045828381.1 ATP-dependent RNA helicase DEAH13 [Trifolium pratense]
MEPLESSGDHVEVKSRRVRARPPDTNPLIMPTKKMKKRKGVEQERGKGRGKVQSNKKQKLSKTQKRKLNKAEDDKNKQLLMEKAIKTLNENTLPEYAFPLLQSSCNINREETVKEKRRRAVHLLKEGLEVPHGDDLSKKQDFPSITEPESEDEDILEESEEKDIIQPFITEREILYTTSTPLGSSQEPIHGNEVVNYESVAEPVADISTDKKPDEIKSSSPTSCSIDEIKSTKSKDMTDEKPATNFNELSNLPNVSAQRLLTPATVVHVYRPSDVQEKRKDLPIVMMEQEIMEAINYNSSVIVCGETGCGKTTQVPQFLYEAGYGSSKFHGRSGVIGVTQPRRVAVLATAKRVAYELGVRLGKEVGFQVRYDKKIGDNCSIKFMTDGILLREVQNDILLRRYSVLILDEAHERSLNTDILIGILSRVIIQRQTIYNDQQKVILSGESISPEQMIFPLKLVLMSATLRVQDFTSGKLFQTPPPVIEVPTRQFPVTMYFAKKTEITDYVGAAYKKILAIHKKLPSGGILVFVTGQREVEDLCRKLRRASKEFVMKKVKGSVENGGTGVHETSSVEGININEINEAFEMPGKSSIQQTDRFSGYDEDDNNFDENESDSYDSETESELEFNDDDDNRKDSENNSNIADVLGKEENLASLKAAFENLSAQAPLSSSNGKRTFSVNTEDGLDPSTFCREKIARENHNSSPGALFVLPLYAMLPAAAQLRVFEEVKEGERLVVVATNVAETSLTIPGIKYVVDTGREKVKNYDSTNGMETYEVKFISKASAAQRAGRAGRTAAGHCYRLYSSAAFNNEFPGFSPAEVEKVPVHGVVLYLKSMLIKDVKNFPFPTPLKVASLVEAENCLRALEALDCKDDLTLLGKTMAHYPLSPRHSRMILTVIKNTRHKHIRNSSLLLAYAVAAAAALSLPNPFVMQYEGSSKDSEMSEKSSIGDDEKNIHKIEKTKRKKLKETSKLAREKFRIVSSDALAIAYALQCFEHSQNSVQFCEDNALHFKTMDEMSKLRQQLLKLVFYQSDKGGLEQEYTWTHGTLEDVEHAWRISSAHYPLPLVEERLICQAICAGWADRVAKRIPISSRVADGGTITRAGRYQSSMVDESIFLHRWSSVSTARPEFLVYNELLETKRPNKEGETSAKRAYMHGVTSVDPSWLVENAKSSCSFSPPLEDPRPFYDAQADEVKCWVIPTFGRFCWQLPKHSMPISNVELRVQVFAYALLEGQVCPCLKSVRKYMSAPPESFLRRESFGQKRVGNLYSKLKSKLIDSSAMLRTVWKENPRELFPEILDWFQQGYRNHFEELWLQMLGEVLHETQEQPLHKSVKRKLKGKSKSRK